MFALRTKIGLIRSNTELSFRRDGFKAMANNTILITGAAGFIGMDLCSRAKENGLEVIAVDAFRDGLYSRDVKAKRAKKLHELYEIKVNQFDLSSEDFELPSDVTHVIHAAAMPGLTYSFSDPQQYITDNEVATLNLIRALQNTELEKFVFVSTSSVYGKYAYSNEESEPQPISPYGLTKLAAEKIVDLYLPEMANYSIARLFSVYGPGQRPDMGYFQFIDAVMNDRPITIFGDGSQSRSNTFISDAVDGIFGVLEKGKNGEKYNIGGGEEVPLMEAIDNIYEIAGKKPNLEFGDPRPGDQQRTNAETSKAKRDFGFNPSTSFKDGIRAQFEWQKRPNLIRS
jgi:nucleoside-diphosphate-sugar epimerase